jgi:putative ABC transport system permease protein
MLITTMAFVLSVLVVQLLQSSFNTIVRRDLSLWKVFEVSDAATVTLFVLVLIGGAFISGFYPAFILSSYQPVTVLKGKFQRSSRGSYLRKGLVIFQFATSAALITSTLIVSKQLTFMNEADLGVSISNTVIVRPPELMEWDSTFIDRVESYKHELSQLPGVINATTSNRIPGNRLGRSFGIKLADQSSDAHYTLSNMGVDYNYFDTYNIKLLAGRKFEPTDHNVDFSKIKSVIINESATKLLGIPSVAEAIGKEVLWGGENGDRRWTIVGVVGDYHQESLKNPMEAMIFRPTYGTYNSTSIKIKAEEKEKTIAAIEGVYKKFFPANLFEYSFLEDRYNSQYDDDNRFGRVISIFTGLAIIVSCLGLIGLSSYTAVQRTKEIGIRKALGASISSIVSLLSIDFVKLVFIAAIMSLPVAYFGMQNWLQAYTYRIAPGWLQFVVPVVIVLIIAALTIIFQILKAARTNPADTLKYE